jgi:hypothetical protein
MTTLEDYKAKGIDITFKTQEELEAENYVTPLNELPVLIGEPGEYVCRDGRRVTVHEVKRTKSKSTTSFNVVGSLWRRRTAIGKNPHMYIWHVSGFFNVSGENPLDIVCKYGDDEKAPMPQMGLNLVKLIPHHEKTDGSVRHAGRWDHKPRRYPRVGEYYLNNAYDDFAMLCTEDLKKIYFIVTPSAGDF